MFDPVTHCAQFIEAKGEITRERQSLTMLLDRSAVPAAMTTVRPGPIRLNIENRENTRALPGVWVAGPELDQLLSRRRPFLSAKRLLTNQTFRDTYHADTLDIDQRLKITSLTFLFTDLKGSTALYDRVGDLVAYRPRARAFSRADRDRRRRGGCGGEDDRRCGHGDLSRRRTAPSPRRCACGRRCCA